MSETDVIDLEMKVLEVDPSKIHEHGSTITGLRAELVEADGIYDTFLYVESVCGGEEQQQLQNIGTWHHEEDAKRVFGEMMNYFKRREYELHRYDNGRIEVKFF